MKLIIGSDHGGFDLKEDIKAWLTEQGHEVIDKGAYSHDSVDYPDIAKLVAEEVVSEGLLGMLFCGTGIGISIAANKVEGVRAALCSEEYSARMSRKHNNANILCMGGRTTGVELARAIVKAWLEESFEAGRHERRVEKIMKLEHHR